MQNNFDGLGRGMLGTILSFGGAAISFLTQMEPVLRVTSLLIGITVGVLTIISLLKGLKK